MESSSDDDEEHHDNIIDIDINSSALDMEKFILHVSDLLVLDDDDTSSSSSRTRLVLLTRQSQSLIFNKSGRSGDDDGGEVKKKKKKKKKNDESLYSLRIVARHDDDDDDEDESMVEETTTIALNAEENRIEINLLSFASPHGDYDDEDFQSNIPFDNNDDDGESDLRVIYGSDYYNLASEDISNADGVIGSAASSVDSPLAILDVIGAGSYLVTDLFGIPGYEQILVLPRIIMDDATVLSHTMELWENDGDGLQLRTELLRVILEHSYVTDGSTVLHPLPPPSVSSSSSSSQFSRKNLEVMTMPGTNTHSKSTTTPSTSVTIPPLTIMIEDELDGYCHELQTNGIQRKRKIVTKKALVENGNNESATAVSTAMLETTREENPGKVPNSLLNEDEKRPLEWLNAIAHTVEHRLGAELSKMERMERSAQTCLDLVNEGRETLHSAMRDDTCGGRNNDPEVIRLRYGMRPRTSSFENNGDGISVVLDLEVDLMMRPVITNTNNSSTATYGGGNEIGISLQDFHLSCFSTNRASSLMGTPPKTIRTSSGVVPTLQPGDCVTILASVLLADLRLMITKEDSRSTMLEMCIQGLWTKENRDLIDSPSSSTINSISNAASSRHGAVLCILRLPIEELFLAPPILSHPPQSNHWIQHEIDFISETKSRISNSNQATCPNIHPFPILPTAIFEYRSPRTLTIDMSSSIQDATIWKELVSRLNARAGGNSFVDFYWKKGDPRLNLVIFGSNMEERAGELCGEQIPRHSFHCRLTHLSEFSNYPRRGTNDSAMVKFLLNSLPESANLTIEDPDEKQHVKALLQSMKKEVDTIKRHRSLSPDAMTPAVINEMASLQIDTDGVASTIKRGWS